LRRYVRLRANEFPQKSTPTLDRPPRTHTGTLLRPGWIITAAHCMKGEYGGGAFGVNFVLHLDDGLRQLVVPGNKTTAYMPTEYDPLNQPLEEEFYGDIALIYLPELVTIGNVQYPRLPESRKEINAAPVLVTGGMGMQETGQTGKTLEFVTVSLVSAVGETPAFAPWPIESDHFVTLDFVTLDSVVTDQDTCEGDSGGGIFIPSRPWAKETKDFELELLAEELVGDEDVLVGVTSYGSASLSCGAAGTFGVYTDVLYWKEWIERTIERVEREGAGASEGGSASPGR